MAWILYIPLYTFQIPVLYWNTKLGTIFSWFSEEVKKKGGKGSSLLFHPFCGICQNSFQENSPTTGCCHQHAWKLTPICLKETYFLSLWTNTSQLKCVAFGAGGVSKLSAHIDVKLTSQWKKTLGVQRLLVHSRHEPLWFSGSSCTS